jgi:hypothetical protein
MVKVACCSCNEHRDDVDGAFIEQTVSCSMASLSGMDSVENTPFVMDAGAYDDLATTGIDVDADGRLPSA